MSIEIIMNKSNCKNYNSEKIFLIYDNYILGIILFCTLFMGVWGLVLVVFKNDIEGIIFFFVFCLVVTILTIFINRRWPKQIIVSNNKIIIKSNCNTTSLKRKNFRVKISNNISLHSKLVKKFMGFDLVEKKGKKRVFRVRCFMAHSCKEAEDCFELLKQITK